MTADSGEERVERVCKVSFEPAQEIWFDARKLRSATASAAGRSDVGREGLGWREDGRNRAVLVLLEACVACADDSLRRFEVYSSIDARVAGHLERIQELAKGRVGGAAEAVDGRGDLLALRSKRTAGLDCQLARCVLEARSSRTQYRRLPSSLSRTRSSARARRSSSLTKSGLSTSRRPTGPNKARSSSSVRVSSAMLGETGRKGEGGVLGFCGRMRSDAIVQSSSERPVRGYASQPEPLSGSSGGGRGQPVEAKVGRAHLAQSAQAMS